MAAYKDRVQQDLDRWIAAGLVDRDKRAAILETLPESRRLDAATALAWVGAILLGVAIIAFVAANWDFTPKLVRFAMLLAAFLTFAGGGAWAAHKDRPGLSNILLTIALDSPFVLVSAAPDISCPLRVPPGFGPGPIRPGRGAVRHLPAAASRLHLHQGL
jgi:hypothetical protein